MVATADPVSTVTTVSTETRHNYSKRKMDLHVLQGLEQASSSSLDKTLKEEKARRKDKEFREFLVHSGAADSLLKLTISLREHEAFTSEKFPLSTEEKTGILKLLFDFYGSQPDPIWDEIDFLRKSNTAMGQDLVTLGKSIK